MNSVIEAKGSVCGVTKLLTNEGLTVKNVTKKENRVVFVVSGRDSDRAIGVLRRNGKEYSIIKDGRLKSRIAKRALRIGLYAGLILGIVAVYFFSQRVTRIEVSQNKRVTEEIIVAQITDETPLPIKKGDIDVDKIIKKIIAVDGVYSASVEVYGDTLKIAVCEEPELPDVVDKSDYTEIKSRYDGIITRLNVYSGRATVSVGDTVKKGQVLIACDMSSPDGVTYKENALGDVYARVWISKEKIITPTIITKYRTGRTEKKVSFFTKNDKFECSFSSYETETNVKYLDGVVPLKYFVTTYYETEEREQEFDFYSNEEGIVKEETDILAQELPDGSTPIRSWYSVKRLDKNLLLVIYYEIELKIN